MDVLIQKTKYTSICKCSPLWQIASQALEVDDPYNCEERGMPWPARMYHKSTSSVAHTLLKNKKIKKTTK